MQVNPAVGRRTRSARPAPSRGAVATKEKVGFAFCVDLLDAYVRSRPGGRELLHRLTGETASDRARDAATAAMEGRGAGRVLLLSLTLAAGLNLQGCNHMILLAPTWNPTEDVQALGRLARPGQQKQSFHYRLGVAGTLSEDIFIRQKDKQGLARAVTSGVLGTLLATERYKMFAVDDEGAASRLASALLGTRSGGVFGARVLDDAARPASLASVVPECPVLEALLRVTVAVAPHGGQNADPNAMLVEEQQRPLVAHAWRAEHKEWLGNGRVERPAPAPRDGAAAGPPAAGPPAPAAASPAPFAAITTPVTTRTTTGGATAAVAGPAALPLSLSPSPPLRQPAPPEEPLVRHARSRLGVLRAMMTRDATVTVTVAGDASTQQHSMARDLAVAQWQTEWGEVVGDAARARFVAQLQRELDALVSEFPDRVVFGWLYRQQASAQHVLVWAANASNFEGLPGNSILGGGQALAMQTHGPGVFGLITTPCMGMPPNITAVGGGPLEVMDLGPCATSASAV